MAEEITITATPQGPYVVKGAVKLFGDDGREIETRGTFALCRCGGSATKPFCDGTHSKIGFAAAERARAEYDAQRVIDLREEEPAARPS